MNILQPRYLAYVRSELELAIRVAGADGARVALLTAPKFSRPGQWSENDPARVDRFNELLRDLAAAHPAVVLIDLAARTSPGSATWTSSTASPCGPTSGSAGGSSHS